MGITAWNQLAAGRRVQAAPVQDNFGVFQGLASKQLLLNAINHTDWAVKLKNTGSGGKALEILNSAGSAVLGSFQDSGVTMQVALTAGAGIATTNVSATGTITGVTGVYSGSMTVNGPMTVNGALTATSLTVGTIVGSGSASIAGTLSGVVPSFDITSTSAGSAAAIRTRLGASGASSIVPASLSTTYNPSSISPIKSGLHSTLYSKTETGGHLTAMSGVTQIDGDYAVAGDHHFGGVFVCRGVDINMRDSGGTEIDNSVCGILAMGEITNGYNAVVRGANIQARNESDTTGTAEIIGIEVNMQHQASTIVQNRVGVALGSISIGLLATHGTSTITGKNAGVELVMKVNSTPWKDGYLFGGNGVDPWVADAALIRTSGTNTIRCAVDVSSATFSGTNPCVLDLPATAIQTTVGAAGGASALPAAPSKYWKVRADGVNYVSPLYLAA